MRDRSKTIDLETGVDKCLQVVEEDRCKIIENLVPAVKPFDTTVLPDLKAPDPFDTAIGILEDRAEAEITDVVTLEGFQVVTLRMCGRSEPVIRDVLTAFPQLFFGVQEAERGENWQLIVSVGCVFFLREEKLFLMCTVRWHTR